MWFIRLNMNDMSSVVEVARPHYKNLAGRAMTSTLVSEEVPPACHPLGPNNKLVFSAGLVTGTTAPTSSRISVGGKSPLTGGIKEANAGSSWASDLAKMQVAAVIVEGKPKDAKKWWGANIAWDAAAQRPKVEFFDAAEFSGKDLYEVYPKVYQRFGNTISVAACGAVGEYGYGNSGVAFNDLKKHPTRYAGRGGLGAVMGSKGLKLLLLDATGAPGVQIADKELFEKGRKMLLEAMSTHDITKPKGGLNTYGTAVLVNIMNEAGGLPTRNFTSGRFEGAPKIAGEAIFEGNKQRMGKEVYNHACSPGCTIQCSNTWFNTDGTERASCVEYESAWAFGANCGIDDLDAIADMIKICNATGLDTIETGATIAVAMNAGVIPFGDSKGAIKLVTEMGKGSPMGRSLGGGTEFAAKAYGIARTPTVKGQAMPAYDPRLVKGMGVTYATTTMGADHTAGYTIAPEILGVSGKQDPHAVEGKAALSRAFQATTAFIDSSGHCLFIAFPILDIPSGFQGLMDECSGVTGVKMGVEDAYAYGAAILKKEKAFNEAAGLSKESDRLPEFMKLEPLPPHNPVFDIPDSDLDSVHGGL